MACLGVRVTTLGLRISLTHWEKLMSKDGEGILNLGFKANLLPSYTPIIFPTSITEAFLGARLRASYY